LLVSPADILATAKSLSRVEPPETMRLASGSGRCQSGSSPFMEADKLWR